MRSAGGRCPSGYLYWEPDDRQANGPNEFNDGANFPGANGSGVNEGIGRLHNKTGGDISRLDGGTEFITSNKFYRIGARLAPYNNGRNTLWSSTFTSNGGP
jgi:hypothetical protein